MSVVRQEFIRPMSRPIFIFLGRLSTRPQIQPPSSQPLDLPEHHFDPIFDPSSYHSVQLQTSALTRTRKPVYRVLRLSKSDGGCGLAVKAPDCGSGYRGFESRQPPFPHFSSPAHLPARSSRKDRFQRRGEQHHPPRIGFVHVPPAPVPLIQPHAIRG